MYYRFQFRKSDLPLKTKAVVIYLEEYKEDDSYFYRCELNHVRNRSEAYAFAVRYSRCHGIRHIFFDDLIGDETTPTNQEHCSYQP